MAEGYIKLFRKLRDNPIYSNSIAVHCWIECLLRANHNQNTFYIGHQKIELEPGQFVTGREEFAKSIQISPSTAWFWILQFKSESMLDIKSTNKFSIFTIINWNEYQGLDSRKTAEKQQKNTINNVKNEKNNTDLDKTARILLDWFNKVMSKNCKTFEPFKSNLAYWLTIYTKEDIAKAIALMPKHQFFSKMETPVVIFRRKNQNKEDVDYIGQLLNSTPNQKQDGQFNSLIK